MPLVASASNSAFFAAGLHFDELASGGHDDVHVSLGVLVLDVIEIEHGLAGDDADADRGEGRLDRRLGGVLEKTARAQLPDGELQCDVDAGDGRGARATIGGEDIAIDAERARPERLEVHSSADTAAD
jgi:hypothetical protein